MSIEDLNTKDAKINYDTMSLEDLIILMKDKRIRDDLSQNDLATIMKLTDTTIYRWENFLSSPTIRSKRKIITFLESEEKEK